MRLERRPQTSRAALLLAPLGAIAFTLAITSLLVAWAGAPVGRAYALLLEGGFGSRFAWTETLTRATPLILTGLAAAVAFRARFWNLGLEGQMVCGAIAATALIFGAAYSLWMYKRVYFGDVANDNVRALTDLNARATELRERGALVKAEVEQLIEDFIVAAVRAERAGFHGVELHGAHGYLLAQFLDGELNQRSDGYGGSFEHRCKVLHAIIDGVRACTGPQFQLGLRLSPERFGIVLSEARELARQMLASPALRQVMANAHERWVAVCNAAGNDQAPVMAAELYASMPPDAAGMLH